MTVGVVLAGGRSSRMGTDKALVAVDGVAMVRRVADALLAGGCSRVWCQGGDADALGALGLDVVPDDRRGEGPLRAIVAALRTAGADDVVLSACDLPHLDGATVAALIRAGQHDPTAAVVVATDAHGVHLLGWWRGSGAERLDRLVGDGDGAGVRSYRAAIEQLDAVAIEVEPFTVRNVNHPDDLASDR